MNFKIGFVPAFSDRRPGLDLLVVGCLLGGYHACHGVLGGRKPTGCENPSAAGPRTGSPRPARNLITVDFPSTARLGLVTRLSDGLQCEAETIRV